MILWQTIPLLAERQNNCRQNNGICAPIILNARVIHEIFLFPWIHDCFPRNLRSWGFKSHLIMTASVEIDIYCDLQKRHLLQLLTNKIGKPSFNANYYSIQFDVYWSVLQNMFFSVPNKCGNRRTCWNIKVIYFRGNNETYRMQGVKNINLINSNIISKYAGIRYHLFPALSLCLSVMKFNCTDSYTFQNKRSDCWEFPAWVFKSWTTINSPTHSDQSRE